MQPVVSDSSVLIHLAKIGRLTLLNEFYGKILITPAIWREVVEEGKERQDAIDVREAYESNWAEISAPTNEPLVKLLEQELHRGEAEAIALALERSALVLLDESDARRIADIYGLRKTGVVGILIRAKEEDRIQSLRKELDRLRNEAGFWISDEMYQKALRAVGES